MNRLDDNAGCLALMRDLGDLVRKHLGFLPDAVLILRDGDTARTLVAANPQNFPDATDADGVRSILTEMLEQATARNREVNRELAKRRN